MVIALVYAVMASLPATSTKDLFLGIMIVLISFSLQSIPIILKDHDGINKQIKLAKTILMTYYTNYKISLVIMIFLFIVGVAGSWIFLNNDTNIMGVAILFVTTLIFFLGEKLQKLEEGLEKSKKQNTNKQKNK